MASDIFDVTPGEEVDWTFTINGLLDGESVVDASLEIRDRFGAIAIPLKTITTSAGVHGGILVSDTTQLKFTLVESETIALHPRQPFYLFNVSLTTSTGRKQFVVPVGRIMPTQVTTWPAVIKLGGGMIALSIRADIVATK